MVIVMMWIMKVNYLDSLLVSEELMDTILFNLQSVLSIHVLMEVPVHNMGTMLPALAQWDILVISVKVYCFSNATRAV